MNPSSAMKRKRKLIKSRLQLKIVGIFLGIALLTLVLQVLTISSLLGSAAPLLPQSAGNELIALLPRLLGQALLWSFLVLIPLTLGVGIVVTFRVAGPIYSFEQYLRRVARGEERAPCKIRKDDELHELCDAINEAVAALRAARPLGEPEAGEHADASALDATAGVAPSRDRPVPRD